MADKPATTRSPAKYCSLKCSFASRPKPVVDRFWAKTVKSDGCWNWTGSKSKAGYGQISTPHEVLYCHRISWTLKNGPIPNGMAILHKCDNPACVNPEHLILGTQRDNMLDMIAKGRQSIAGLMYNHKGERHPRAKLSEDQVREIRSIAAQKAMPQHVIAEMFNVSHATVKAIVSRRLWKHLP